MLSVFSPSVFPVVQCIVQELNWLWNRAETSSKYICVDFLWDFGYSFIINLMLLFPGIKGSITVNYVQKILFTNKFHHLFIISSLYSLLEKKKYIYIYFHHRSLMQWCQYCQYWSTIKTSYVGYKCQGYVLAFHVCKIALITDTFTWVTSRNVVKIRKFKSHKGFFDLSFIKFCMIPGCEPVLRCHCSAKLAS